MSPNERTHLKVGDYVCARSGGTDFNNQIGQIKRIESDGYDRYYAYVEWFDGTHSSPYVFALKKVDPLTLLAMQMDGDRPNDGQ